MRSARPPLDSVRTLQSTLRAKANNEAAARFYSLWDKVYREDVLSEAYWWCRANRGALGVDGEALRRIHFGIAERGAREVVDADFSDYFNTIPHGDLLRYAPASSAYPTSSRLPAQTANWIAGKARSGG